MDSMRPKDQAISATMALCGRIRALSGSGHPSNRVVGAVPASWRLRERQVRPGIEPRAPLRGAWGDACLIPTPVTGSAPGATWWQGSA